MYLEKEDTDFLSKYNTMNGFYSTFFLTLTISIYLFGIHLNSFQSNNSSEEIHIVWPTG